MSGLDLHDGDVLRLTNIRNTFAVNKDDAHRKVNLSSVSFKAPKGKVFVAVLLGVEPKDGSAPMDLEATMKLFGWIRTPDSAEV